MGVKTMRNVKEFNATISDTRKCVEYLDSLSRGRVLFCPDGGEWSMLDSNEILNIGLSVHRLMRDFIEATERAEDFERRLDKYRR
jgi:hypothetical protein